MTVKQFFNEIGVLDKQFSNNENYIFHIDGFICDCGNVLKSKEIINYAYTRLRDKQNKNYNNSLQFNISNCIHSLALLKCESEITTSNLLSIPEFNSARNSYYFVQKDNILSYERANTNSANILKMYGRFYEAILTYKRINKYNPQFGVSYINMANTIDYYIRLCPQISCRLLWDEVILINLALKDPNLKKISTPLNIKKIVDRKNTIINYLKQNKFHLKKYKYTPKVNNYYKYCLENNLFLNYDFGYFYDKMSIQDTFFPSLIELNTEAKSERCVFMSESIYFSFQMFNQILEAYTSSRYLFFKSLNQKVDSIDFNVNYIYTYDYTKHSLLYGIQKMIFSNLYNCLDKIANLTFIYFLKKSDYNKINIYFNSLQNIEFINLIRETNNFHLLALSNLSLDFKEGNQYYPLQKLRNKITHTFISINEEIAYDEKYREYEIMKSDLVDYLLQLFNIVKSAIFYFITAIENEKELDQKIIFPMNATFESKIFK
jgi:hypothetical protein